MINITKLSKEKPNKNKERKKNGKIKTLKLKINLDFFILEYMKNKKKIK